MIFSIRRSLLGPKNFRCSRIVTVTDGACMTFHLEPYWENCYNIKTQFADSPGVPPSATAHELFRGFSYVAPHINANGSGPSSSSANAANANSNVEDQDSTATVVEVNTKHSVASRIKVVSWLARTSVNITLSGWG